MIERITRIWPNPIYRQLEVILETSLEGGGTYIGGVAKIEDDEIVWFPDIDEQRLLPAGITREDIVEDLAAIAANIASRLEG